MGGHEMKKAIARFIELFAAGMNAEFTNQFIN